MSAREVNVEILPFRKSFARSVKRVAEKSWSYTYKDIYSSTHISDYIAENYRISNLALLEKYVDSGTISLNVARINSRIVGFCHIGKEKEFTLFRIYLLPRWIGKGIGSYLLAEGERWVRDSGGSSYIARVQEKNATGTRFYEKSGFTRDPELDHDDELCYRKELTSE